MCLVTKQCDLFRWHPHNDSVYVEWLPNWNNNNSYYFRELMAHTED